ncbi:MAG: hypothetical protein U0570_08735 [Phycisphaerales bacterium]
MRRVAAISRFAGSFVALAIAFGAVAQPQVSTQSPSTDVELRAAKAQASRKLAESGASALAPSLREPRASVAFRAAIEAIADCPVADGSLLPELTAACDAATATEKKAIVRAISSVRERAAMHYLVSLLDVPSLDADLRASIVWALQRQTGAEGVGESAAAWHARLTDAEKQDDSAWRAALLRDLAGRADREQASRAMVQTRLLDSLRALHLATPADKRWPLISSMISDPLPCVNLLGLELVSRELSAGNKPDARLGVDVLPLLEARDATIREQAAILIANLAPPGGSAALKTALDQEANPATASALLNALSRLPGPESEASILRWADPAIWATMGTQVRDASLDACWALYRAGSLRSPEASDRVLKAVRAVNLADLNGSGCRLRAELGDDSDLEAIVVLLGSKIPAQRLATAEALVSSPEYLPRILAAAREDPLLIDVAVRGVLTLAPNVPNFSAIEEATRRVPDQRRAALTVIASVLNEDEILEAARRLTADPALREAVLAVLSDPRRVMAERTEPGRLSYTASALMELAELRIEMGKYAEAITALESLPELPEFAPPDKIQELRTIALVGINRLDQARQVGAKPDAWLRALELCSDQAHASTIASTIETQMGESLSEQQRAKLETLKNRIASKQR